MTLKEIETEIKAILDESERKKVDLQQKIETAEQGEQDATIQATEAYKSGDVTAYHKAQDDIRHHKDAQRMFTDMLKDENEKPLLDKEAYQVYLDGVKAVLDEATATARKKTADLLDKMIAVAQKNNDVIDEGNKLMHTLQFEIMKDDACMTNAAGDRVFMQHLEKKYKDYQIVQLKDMISENWLYKALKNG